MPTYQIEHREELLAFFCVEAASKEEALNKYRHLVSEGKIDFGDMEMVDSSDRVFLEREQEDS